MTYQKKKMAKLPEQINTNEIVGSVLMFNEKKRYSILSYSNKEQVVFQTPLFETAIDIEKYNDYGDYYYIIPEGSEGDKLIEFIEKMEKHVIEIIFKNKKEWFPNIDNVTFRSLIKNYTDDNVEYKVIKFKIPYTTNTNVLYVENTDNLDLSVGERNKISVKELDNGLVRMIINVSAIWLADNMFGIYIRPINIEEIRIVNYDYEFQNTNIINETLTKTIHSVSKYIDSDTDMIDDKQSDEKINIRRIGRHMASNIFSKDRETMKKAEEIKQESESSNKLTLDLSENSDNE